MRVFWDHAPGGGEIHLRQDVCPGMQRYTDDKICRSCGTVDYKSSVRPRWVKHEAPKFYPCLMPLPPKNKPLVPSELVRGKFVRVKDFLIRVTKQLKGVERTPTGQPKGFLWVFWRLEDYPGSRPGKMPPGTYLDLSVYYSPKGGLARAYWKMSRDTAPVGFPHDIVPG